MLPKILYILKNSLRDTFIIDEGLIKRRIGNHIMFLDPKDSGISNDLKNMLPNSPDREPCFMKVLREELKEGMTAIDLGANIGYVTLIMAEIVGPRGKVYAIEPNPTSYRILKKNIEANGYNDYVEPFNIGISDKNSQLKFYVSEKTNLCSMSPTKHTTHSIDIKVESLDDFIDDGRRLPNFIKMDIEGHEVEALSGMYRILKRAKPPVKVLIEVHPIYYSQEHNLEKVLQKLIEMGFNCKKVISAGIARPKFFTAHRYEPKEICTIGKMQRGVYTNISNEHMLMAACHRHEKYYSKTFKKHIDTIVRSIMIEKNE